MIWEALLKGGALVTFAQGAMALVDRVFSDEVLPNRTYNSVEAAALLGLERVEVLTLITTEKIKAKKVDGNYRILGSNLLEYMAR